MRAVRVIQTFSVVTVVSVALALSALSALAEDASRVCHDKHHHDSETDYKRPHIHAKPDVYVRPYSSSDAIRGPYDTRGSSVRRYDDSDRDFEFDPDRADDYNLHDSDEPDEE